MQFFMKAGAALFFAAVLAACQSTTSSSDLAGKGKLVISAPLAAFIEKANAEDRIVFDQQLAVDVKSRYVSESYCEHPAPAVCYPPKYDSAAAAAVARCEQDGKFQCALYSSFRRVVWDGPVYVRAQRSPNYRPYNGKWPATVEWPGVVNGPATLVARNGDIALQVQAGASECSVKMSPLGRRDGIFELICAEKEASGTYRRNPGDEIVGNGKASNGPKVRLIVRLAAGGSRLD